MTNTNIVIFGSNFLASAIFAKLFAFNNINITVIDRKDPTIIQNFNNDTFRIIYRYCKDIKYADLFTGRVFGDPKNNKKIQFRFKDWINEPIAGLLADADIIIHAGSIYDNLYAKINSKETLAVNLLGLNNILNNLPYHPDKKPLFIFPSSINVYGDQTNSNQTEITEDGTVPNPQRHLDFALYTEENMIKAHAEQANIDYLILRLGTLIGEFTPRDSLVTAAVSALLLQKKEFEVTNAMHSIELLDIRDLGNLFNIIMSLYEKKGEQYDKMVNQVYNIVCEEKEEKTVKGVVESIYSSSDKLPTITSDHIKGIADHKLKMPKIAYGDSGSGTEVKFDKQVSRDKALTLMNFKAMNPIVYTLIPQTVNYLLNYILVDFSDTQRRIFTKIFYLPQTPTPETVSENVHQDVKTAVSEINENISQSL